MAVPNLRFNKSLTKKLVSSSPECKANKTTIEWQMENHNKIYGSYHKGLFKLTLFVLQRVEDERYRLVVSDDSGLCLFYLIDNIDEYLDFIGVEELDMIDNDLASEIIKETVNLPNTGILYIDEEKIYLYDHTNY